MMKKISMPVRYACFWTASLLYWEVFLRVCIDGGIRTGNLTLLVFLPAEALFLTVLSGLFGRRRILSCIGNVVPGLLLSMYYLAQLVYYRVAGSMLPVGMLGAGEKAFEEFGWTMRDAIVRSLIDVPLLLVPVIAIALLSLAGGRAMDEGNRRAGNRAAPDRDPAETAAGSDDDAETDDCIDLDGDTETDDCIGPDRNTNDPVGPHRDEDDLIDLDRDTETDRYIDPDEYVRASMEKDASDGSMPDEKMPDTGKPEGAGFLQGYSIRLRAVCLLLAVALWPLGAASLSLFGRGRDSAWYVYHSDLTNTDISAERIGALATTTLELYIYRFGKEQDLSETLVSEIDLEALELPDKGGEKEQAVTAIPAASAADEASADPEEEQIPDHPWENEAIDFSALAEMTEDKNLKTLCESFALRKPTSTNEYTGLFEGYNLVYMCCEAFSGYGIDPEITPLLYEMANGGIVLENFYNSFPNITTNGEYAFDTALWPDVSRSASNGSVAGSFPQSAGVFMPYGLGDLFTADGVSCYAYHNYRGDYYMRDYSWPNLGYENAHIKFLGKGMTFTNPWPSSDLEMMEQSVDDYIGEDRFHAYYMTFGGHGPFDQSNYIYRKNIDKVRELAGERFQVDKSLGYFCGTYELELAMQYMTKRLREAGKLNKTVFVLIGDHFPYYLSDEAVAELNGGSMPDAIERCHSTCIIYNPAMEEPIHSDVYCCNVDILPTILNLFNIDFDSRLLMGTDIFSDGIHRARLYNGSFVTKYVSFERTGGKKKWAPEAENLTDEEKDAYMEAMLDYTDNEYAVSLGMLENNFYFYVWKNAGLMNEEEVRAEEQREKTGRSVYQMREEEERIKAEEAAAERAAQEAGKEGMPADGQQPAPADGQQPAAPADGQQTVPAGGQQAAPAGGQQTAPADGQQAAPAAAPQ